MTHLSTLERGLRLGLLVVPAFAIASAIEVGCVGGPDSLSSETYGPSTGNGSGNGSYGYGYTRGHGWEQPSE